MNSLLIAILDIVNKLLAVFIVISSTVEGYRGDFAGYIALQGAPQQALWALIGFVIGLALAGIFSGVLAAIITIARELIVIREQLALRAWTGPPPP